MLGSSPSCACDLSRLASYETEVVRIDQENDRLTEERRVYVRCRVCNPQHQLRHLGEQAEVEIVKKTIPSGLFVSLKFVDGYDGRSGVIWTLQDGRLAKRRVSMGERLLDGRVQVTSDLQGQIVIDDRTDLRESRAARGLPQWDVKRKSCAERHQAQSWPIRADLPRPQSAARHCTGHGWHLSRTDC